MSSSRAAHHARHDVEAQSRVPARDCGTPVGQVVVAPRDPFKPAVTRSDVVDRMEPMPRA